MSFPAGCYRKTPNIRVRPVHELELCLVFTPDDPNVYSLNPSAWMVMELCNGRNWDELEKAYRDAVQGFGPVENLTEELADAVRDLEAKGIVSLQPS